VVGLASWSFLDAQLARGGVLLWVRTPDFNAERRALEVLHRYAAHVHLHVPPARRVQLDDEPGPSAFIALVGRRERAPGASPRRLLPAIAYPSDARRYDSFRRRRTAPGTPAVRLRLLLGTRYWATSAALMMAAAF
jgi:hypothetical protein